MIALLLSAVLGVLGTLVGQRLYANWEASKALAVEAFEAAIQLDAAIAASLTLSRTVYNRCHEAHHEEWDLLKAADARTAAMSAALNDAMRRVGSSELKVRAHFGASIADVFRELNMLCNEWTLEFDMSSEALIHNHHSEEDAWTGEAPRFRWFRVYSAVGEERASFVAEVRTFMDVIRVFAREHGGLKPEALGMDTGEAIKELTARPRPQLPPGADLDL